MKSSSSGAVAGFFGGMAQDFLLNQPKGITAGPDGALWFTEYGPKDKIGRITTAGVITQYPVPTSNSGLDGITAGPDGALWFAESLDSRVAERLLDAQAEGAALNGFHAADGAESSLNVLRFMQEGKIVLINLAPQNRLSEQLGDAIGALALAHTLSVPVLFAITIVSSLTSILSQTGLRSLFPLLVPERLWERVNAIDSNGYLVATIVGPR